MRLRTQLTLTFALLAVTPLLLVVPWVGKTLRATLSQELSARLDTAQGVGTSLLEDEETNVRRAIQALASSTEMEDIARDLHEGASPLGLKARIVELMRGRQLGALALLDAHGTVWASGHLPASVGDVDPTLFALTRGGEDPSLPPRRAILIDVRTDQGITQAPALLAAASPQDVYGNVRLWVVGGMLLDAAFCERVTKATGARVELHSGGALQAAAGDAQQQGHQRTLWLGPGLEVRLSYSDQTLRAAEASLTLAFLSTTAAALFVAGVLGYLMARVTTRPVEALRQASQKIAQGNWDVRVDATAGGELGELIAAFDKMTFELRETTQKLITSERIAAWQEVARRLAHELKNPLTPIQMSLETLLAAQKESHPSFQALFAQSAGALLEEVERLRRIIDEFSKFARLPKPQRSPFDLGALVQQVTSLYPSDDRIRLHVDVQPLSVDADRDQVTQVLLNLLQNAHEALPLGGEVWVRVLPKNGRALVEVEDTGPGVPEALRSRIFEPYVTGKSHGTGLGLAIASRICQEHGGGLEMDGRPGKGALFTLWLPL